MIDLAQISAEEFLKQYFAGVGLGLLAVLIFVYLICLVPTKRNKP